MAKKCKLTKPFLRIFVQCNLVVQWKFRFQNHHLIECETNRDCSVERPICVSGTCHGKIFANNASILKQILDMN